MILPISITKGTVNLLLFPLLGCSIYLRVLYVLFIKLALCTLRSYAYNYYFRHIYPSYIQVKEEGLSEAPYVWILSGTAAEKVLQSHI